LFLSTPPNPISLKSILILSTTYVSVFLVVSFLLAFPRISHVHSSSPHSWYMPFPSNAPSLDHSNYVFGEEYKLWSFSICSFLKSTVRHNTQNNTTIKWNTAHKTTHTINTLHRMKIQQSQLQLYKVELTKISLLYTKQ
jgi:hypothetical protein